MLLILEDWLLFSNNSETVFNTLFLFSGGVLSFSVSCHEGGSLGGLTVPPWLRDISEGERWVLQASILPPQDSTCLSQPLTKMKEFPKHNT